MKGFKFIETLEATFEKETITNANDIEPELSMSRQEILNTFDGWLSKGLALVIDRIDSHYIYVTTHQTLHGSSYVEPPTKLRNPQKGLINIKNKDTECFRWCHIRHLNPQRKILRELRKMTNNLLKGWIIQTLNFLSLKNIITKLRLRTASESTYLVMKKDNYSLFTFLKKSSKIK